jgi:hypothetical protein
MGDEDLPAENFPLGECEGDCDGDGDCAVRQLLSSSYRVVIEASRISHFWAWLFRFLQGSLLCFQRDSTEAVPGCSGEGQSRKDYCYDPNPDSSPTAAPIDPNSGPPVDTLPPGTVTYIPGEATVFEFGLLLSTGLTSRKLATKGETVKYDIVGESNELFHKAPDGKYQFARTCLFFFSRFTNSQLPYSLVFILKLFAMSPTIGGAVFEDKDTGGWIYVSNSESSSDGGVGAITFDSQGRIIGYKRILTGTQRNCGGGKTWYNTWITCEEVDGGQIYEVRYWC